MIRRIFIYLLISCLLIHLNGCYSMRIIAKEDFNEEIGNGDLEVTTNDNLYYFFEENNYEISNDTLWGEGFVKYNPDDNFNESFKGSIPISSIEKIEQDELNPVTTTILISGGILLLVLMTWTLQIAESFSDI